MTKASCAFDGEHKPTYDAFSPITSIILGVAVRTVNERPSLAVPIAARERA